MDRVVLSVRGTVLGGDMFFVTRSGDTLGATTGPSPLVVLLLDFPTLFRGVRRDDRQGAPCSDAPVPLLAASFSAAGAASFCALDVAVLPAAGTASLCVLAAVFLSGVGAGRFSVHAAFPDTGRFGGDFFTPSSNTLALTPVFGDFLPGGLRLFCAEGEVLREADLACLGREDVGF